MEKIQFKNMNFTNSTFLNSIIFLRGFGEVRIGDSSQNQTNIYMDTISISTPSALIIQEIVDFELHNIEINSFTVTPQTSPQFVYFNAYSNSLFTIKSMKVSQSDFQSSSLIFTETSLDLVTLANIEVSDTVINSGSDLISLKNIKSIQFDTGNFSGVTVSDTSDVDSSILKIQDKSLQDDLNSTIQNIQVTNSQISLFNIGTLSGSSSAEQTFEFANIYFNDMMIPSSRSMIDTSGFTGDGNITISMRNLTFVRVNYTSNGNNLKFSHNLGSEVVVTNSNFNDSDSSSILLDRSSDDSTIKTFVRFENCTFFNNIVKSVAAIQVNNAVKLTVVDSVFVQTASLFERSTLFHSQYNSKIVISN